ncbi:lipocalin family protein [Spongiimicrobium salis]|uniref:lipocalin family protein n=1 Tax=Spongiimicrobium salis TaxID=1667022 RepID=UPI00374DA92D
MEQRIIKRWRVTKMERMTKPLDIYPKMNYHFKADHTVAMITQIGSTLKGIWKLKDSVLTISVKGESKEFSIQKLTEDTLIVSSGEFRFYLKE